MTTIGRAWARSSRANFHVVSAGIGRNPNVGEQRGVRDVSGIVRHVAHSLKCFPEKASLGVSFTEGYYF